MRVLLSTIGSRGDVQPLVALALELKDLEQDVRLCVPPDFREWIEGLGLPVTPIGPDVRKAAASLSSVPITPERARQMAEASVANQFDTITEAAQGCDVIVGATALQIAAPSVAEKLGIPYVFVAYCPTVLPSPQHAPIVLRIRGELPAPENADKRELWAKDAARFNDTFGAILNARRTAVGLSPVTDVRGHIFTGRPWLACDPTLGPWPDTADDTVVQTGAWILRDERPLTAEIEAFLDAGDPPIYFGFGSMRVPPELGREAIESARALGRRAIVSRGWADLSLLDSEPDCLAIGEANLYSLFRRMAAIVHHGGAGTTATAALGGAPQLVVPQMYDQHYWAQRVGQLGTGTAHAAGPPTAESLTNALERILQPDVVSRARAVAEAVRTDGTRVGAERLIAAAHLLR